jgi:hypothetical protein
MHKRDKVNLKDFRWANQGRSLAERSGLIWDDDDDDEDDS